MIAGWSSPVARRAHNPKVASSNLAPATKHIKGLRFGRNPFFMTSYYGFLTALENISKIHFSLLQNLSYSNLYLHFYFRLMASRNIL